MTYTPEVLKELIEVLRNIWEELIRIEEAIRDTASIKRKE